MSKTLKVSLITFIAFGMHFLFDAVYFRSIRSWLHEVINQLGVSHLAAYVLVGVPIFAATLLIGSRSGFFSNLGLDKSFVKALAFSVLCTSPMFLGFAFFFDFNTEIKLNTLLISIVAAGFFEELYFRGFLFGQLFKHTSLGFVASVLSGALLFGLVHLYQSTDLMELAGIFLITFIGAILFAWAYTEWNYNLWVPVLLHALMNLAWEMFNISNNALGGVYSNVFRAITIALIIAITIWYKKRKGIPLEINRHTFFMKKAGAGTAYSSSASGTIPEVAG